MEYLVFPFGKYKGVKLEDLPSTYIVFALESFDLPDDLNYELYTIMLGRLQAFSHIGGTWNESSEKEFDEWIAYHVRKYEK